MRTCIIISFLLLAFKGLAQDTFFQESNPVAKEQAIEITNKYIPELGLTGKQQVLFQKKVEKFQIKRMKVEKEFSGKAKLDMLYKLQKEETVEMNDILTRPQLEVYKNIKPTIQPLETLKE